MNDAVITYLRAQYIPGVFAAADFATLLQHDFAQRSGTYTARFLALMAAAGV